jgi:hypothetical protein
MFKYDSGSVEQRTAWQKVIDWLDDILCFRVLTDKRTIGIYHQESTVCPHCHTPIRENELQFFPSDSLEFEEMAKKRDDLVVVN